MAAFPYQHPIFLLDSVFLPNTPTNKMPSSLEEGDMSSSCFSSYVPQPLQENLSHVSIHETNCLDNNTTTTNAFNSDTEPSELDTCDDQVSHKKTPLDKKRKSRDDSSSVSAQSKAITVKEVKGKKQKKINNGEKETEEQKRKSDKKVLEEPPSGYIHVRARRGQATDSHSLAERVRREKISERMKLLQGLVPGCDKITGKAVMLDEIINYVQSLQYQVEFLSMKLASVNPVAYDFGADLDGLMVISEKVKSLGSSSTLPSSIHQSNLAQPTTFADTIPTTRNKYCIQDNAVSLLLQQGQLEMLNAFSQDNENLLWDVDDHRQRFLNQCGFNNLCSFQ